jgi:hypothetical protein
MPYKDAFIIALVFAVVFAGTSAFFFVLLASEPPCNGGATFGPISHGCPGPTPPFVLAQLGHVEAVRGSYSAWVVITSSLFGPGLVSNQLAVTTLNGSGQLSGVVLESTQGTPVANYSLGSTQPTPAWQNWTTAQSVTIWTSAIFQLTAPENLTGQIFWVEAPTYGTGVMLG